MVSKLTLQKNLSIANKNLSDKKQQIKQLRRSSRFRGVTVQAQFDIGRAGLKSFRSDKKLQRKRTLVQLGIANSELPELKDNLNLRKIELINFKPSGLNDLI